MEIKRIKNYEASLVISLFDKYRMFYKQPTDPALAQTYIKERLDKNESVIFVAIVRDQGEEYSCWVHTVISQLFIYACP
jgi:hypothetical protein